MKRLKRFKTPHKRYWKDVEVCYCVKDEYFKLTKDVTFDKRKIVSRVATDFNVNKKTLRGWINKWKTDISWMPFDTSNHGLFHRIFTDKEEEGIMDYIDMNYISEGEYFSDKEFQTLAFEAFEMIHGNDDEIPNFSCSAHFIHNFKERHDVSSRLAHFKQRNAPKTNENVSEEINSFKATVQSIIEQARLNGEPVINGDETGFQILPNSIKTWAYKNSKNISINTLDSTKARVSVMASITSNNEKMPLFIIASANTEEEKEDLIGEINQPNQSSFSTKSYMTTDNFIEYLQFLRKQFNSNTTINLIVDSYASHKSLRSLVKAKQLNINLIFIPSGLTDKLQPLDIAVFAPLKKIVNSKIARFLFGNKCEVQMKRTVQFIQEAYDELSIDNLVNAWDQYY